MEENKRQIKELIFDLADEKLYQIVISNPRNKEKIGAHRKSKSTSSDAERPAFVSGNGIHRKPGFP